ncbi:hypothetical protein SAMN02745121_09249, partial [Nannocystis exedens]
ALVTPHCWREIELLDGLQSRLRRTTTNKGFGRAFTSALRNAEKIHFNLTGIRNFGEAFQLGKAGLKYKWNRESLEFLPQNATNTEFTTVLRTPEFLSKTQFWRDGKRVSTETVLREAGIAE